MSEEDPRPVPTMGYRDFFETFFRAKGAMMVMMAALISSSGVGCIIGLIPRVTADRFARLRHGYVGPPCSTFDRLHKPEPCQAGNEDAQSSGAWASVVQSFLSLACGSVVGSLSDVYGRRPAYAMSLSLTCIETVVVLYLVAGSTGNPTWYYVSKGMSGAVSFLGTTFSALSDVLPPEHRSSGYGLLMAGVYVGYITGPSLTLVMTEEQLAITSTTATLFAAMMIVFCLPETTPTVVLEENRARMEANRDSQTSTSYLHDMLRPIREISILKDSHTLRLVAIASFFNSMVFASDSATFLYYMEEELDARVEDVAAMNQELGITGIIVQTVVLQGLVRVLGEKGLLLLAFCAGIGSNLLYGMAKSIGPVYVGLFLSQITKLSFPILSSFASQGASEMEQGRIQGALAASNAIAYAIGPLSMQFIYHRTRDGNQMFGPGSMYLYAAVLYLIGTIFVSLIPSKRDEVDPLVEPLLSDPDEVDPQLQETVAITESAPPNDTDSDGDLPAEGEELQPLPQ